jgi:hypothetical protein
LRLTQNFKTAKKETSQPRRLFVAAGWLSRPFSSAAAAEEKPSGWRLARLTALNY